MAYSSAHLIQADEPWILKSTVNGDNARALEQTLADDGVTARVLSGTRARTTRELMDEFASQLEFPEYFGHNWNALADCLTDLSWLNGLAYVIAIDQAGYLLEHEPENTLILFLRLMNDVCEQWAAPVNLGEDWDRPATPFHLLLCDSPEHFSAFRARIGAATVEIPDLHWESQHR